MKTWYVYSILDPSTNNPFYIGKGTGNRMNIHMTRALHWSKTGKSPSGANFHLYNKLIKINSSGNIPIYKKIFEDCDEKTVLKREEHEIRRIGIENLCNLTYGGEGETRSEESIEKIRQKRIIWNNSDEGLEWRKNLSSSRTGKGNPMYGHKFSEEEKKKKVHSMLSVPRWNKGLKGDPRSKGPQKGSIPHNAKKCSAINKQTGEIFYADSMVDLCKKINVSKISIYRMLNNTYKTSKLSDSWIIIIENILP